MYSRCVLLATLALILGFTPNALAQQPYDPVQDVTDNPLKSYHGSDIDTIELATGNLSVKIPLISYPQRGSTLHLGFYLNYAGVAGVPGAALVTYTYFQNRQQWMLSAFEQLSYKRPLSPSPRR